MEPRLINSNIHLSGCCAAHCYIGAYYGGTLAHHLLGLALGRLLEDCLVTKLVERGKSFFVRP